MDGKLLSAFMAETAAARNAREEGSASDSTTWQYVAQRLPMADWEAMQTYFANLQPDAEA